MGATATDDRLLTRKQAAEVLGFQAQTLAPGCGKDGRIDRPRCGSVARCDTAPLICGGGSPTEDRRERPRCGPGIRRRDPLKDCDPPG